MALLLLGGCVSPAQDTANPATEFPGTLLQLDRFYNDFCFILACGTPDCSYTTVYVIEEGSGYFHDKKWEWDYEPPSIYNIDGSELYVYPRENECWQLEGDVSLFSDIAWSMTLEACPCTLDLYE